MSGKRKQAQRTKGNTKASSSARAADFVHGSGGFIGFGAMGSDLGYVPVTATDDPDMSVDADFRMLLKKVTKKDTATKLKALGEIATLCGEKDQDDVKGILPFWPRIYNKLAIDSERRVREASHKTFHSVINQVGRDLAPHLKALIGPWLVSQCDPYAPAATAAKSAFHAAFPPAKQTSVIVFCKQEIVAHIEDNLFTQLPQTLSDPKITEAEDMQSKYERVIAGSLGAWRILLTQAPPQTDMIESYQSILGKAAFWKLQKHQSELIRAAFYEAVSALCEAHPAQVVELKSKFCPAVLYSMDDTAPLVCPALWESVLHVVTTVQDWWSVINPRKGMLPKLWRLLKAGGDGSAFVICPNLLPLLSTMPPQHTVCSQQFVEEFNSALLLGLSLEKVQSSARDVGAILRTFMECARFIITSQTALSETTGQALDAISAACIDQLLHVLEACLVEKSDSLHSSAFYELFTKFLSFTESKSELKTVNDGIWTKLNDLMLAKTLSTEPSQSYILRRMVVLIGSLLLPTTSSQEKKDASPHKVRFATEPVEKPSKESSKEIQLVYLTANTSQYTMVTQMTRRLPEICQRNPGSKEHIELLCHLLQMCGHNSGVLSLSEEEGSADVMEYLDKVLLTLVGNGSDDTVMETTVRLILSLEEDNVADAMDSTIQRIENSADLFSSVIKTSITLSSQHKSLQKWLAGEKFGDRVVEAARELCGLIGDQAQQERRTCLLNVVSAALTGVSGESVLAPSFIEKIVPELVKAIPRPEDLERSNADCLNSAVYFVCELASSLFSAFKENVSNPDYSILMTELFKLNCHWSVDLNPDLKPIVASTWQTVIQKGANVIALLQAFAPVLKSALLTDSLTWERLTELSAIGKSLVDSAGKKEGDYLTLLQRLKMDFAPSDIALTGLIINSNLPFTNPPKGNVITDNDVLRDMAPVCFNACVGTYCEDEVRRVKDVCRGVAYCKAVRLSERQAFLLQNLSQIQSTLQSELTPLSLSMDDDSKSTIFKEMLSESKEFGGLSALALKVLMENVGTRSDFAARLSEEINQCKELTEGVAHTLLAVIDYVPQSEQENQISAMVDATHQRAEAGLKSVIECHRYLSVLSELLSAQDSNFSGESDSFIVSSTLIPFMQQWPHVDDNFFLFESEVTAADWERVQLVAQVIRFMRVMLEKSPAQLTAEHWDFILCSMLSWIQSCNESVASLQSGDVVVRTFATQVFQLVSQVALCIENITSDMTENYPPQIQTEWNEFFSQGSYTVLLPVFVSISEKLLQVKVGVSEDLLLSSLAMATSHCPLEHLLNHSLPAKLVADDKSGMSDNLQTLLNHLCPLLLQNHRAIQYCSFTLLRRLVAEVWKTEESSSADDEKRQPPSALWNIMDLCQDAMLAWLSGYRIGDKWSAGSYTEEQSAATAYLLSWTLLIELFTAATPIVRAAYATFLRESEAISTLMFVLFTVMPDTPLQELKDKLSAQSPSGKLSSSCNLFAEQPAYSSQGVCKEGEVGHLACSVYYKVLRHLPALARQWWNEQDRRVADIVDKFTAKYASPILCDEQISEVSENVFSPSNMTVKTRPVAREVVAIYGVDEASLELLVSLAENHPLGPLKVESGKKTGIENTQWRNWMLQLTTFLLHQNGSIADGLLLWKRNVDKKFEGVEECMICFSIIHGSTCHLPKLQCRTCKKKYHSACLYKWFSTSNNSSCPLCRNLF